MRTSAVCGRLRWPAGDCSPMPTPPRAPPSLPDRGCCHGHRTRPLVASGHPGSARRPGAGVIVPVHNHRLPNPVRPHMAPPAAWSAQSFVYPASPGLWAPHSTHPRPHAWSFRTPRWYVTARSVLSGDRADARPPTGGPAPAWSGARASARNLPADPTPNADHVATWNGVEAGRGWPPPGRSRSGRRVRAGARPPGPGVRRRRPAGTCCRARDRPRRCPRRRR